jgi:hypothetical protein
VKTLSTFYDLIIPELPGITTPMVDLQLVQIARDFLIKTSCWRAPFDALDLIAQQLTYDLSPSEPATEVVKVTKLTAAGSLLWDERWFPKQRTDTTIVVPMREAPKWDRDKPPFTLSDDMTQITLIEDEAPGVDLAGGLLIEGAMTIVASSTAKLPDLLWLVHSEAMRVGVLSRLMVMGAGKPWSNPTLGADYRLEYNRLKNVAASNAQTGNTHKPLHVRKWG